MTRGQQPQLKEHLLFSITTFCATHKNHICSGI
uniref:Uncharacterized protein n=1 Tax=Arundo donax TaxID=35708 RepID=A0A0A9AX59_ARUDO